MKTMTSKISHIIITLLLVTLTMGVSVSKHYCGGLLVEVSFFSGHVTGCQEEKGACAMGDCCRDEHQIIRMQEKYIVSSIHDSVQFFPVILAIIDLNLLRLLPFDPWGSGHLSFAESPPPPELMAILSRLQVFRL